MRCALRADHCGKIAGARAARPLSFSLSARRAHRFLKQNGQQNNQRTKPSDNSDNSRQLFEETTQTTRDNSFKVIHPWRNTRPFSCSPGIRLVRPALSGLAWRWKAKCPTPSRCRPVFPRDVGGHAPTPSRLSALSPTLSALLSALAVRLSARLSGQTRCFSAHLSRL